MKKTIIRAAAMLVVLASLILCFASCGEEVKKITVDVAIFEIEDGEKSVWLRRRTMQLEEGKTADEAIAVLCEIGEATYTKDTSGMYDSFKKKEGSIKLPAQKTLEDGTVEYYHYGWALNDVVQSNIDSNKNMSDYVMQEGDHVEIFIQKDTIKVVE